MQTICDVDNATLSLKWNDNQICEKWIALLFAIYSFIGRYQIDANEMSTNTIMLVSSFAETVMSLIA